MTAPQTLQTSPLPINLSEVQINDDRVKVSSEECATVFVNEQSLTLDPSALLELYLSVVALAKLAGAKLTYQRKTKKKIIELQPSLKADLQRYAELYSTLKAGWQSKVESGIYPGYCDDKEINRLHRISAEMVPMLYRVSPIGQALSIQSHLERLRDDLERSVRNEDDLSGNKYPI